MDPTLISAVVRDMQESSATKDDEGTDIKIKKNCVYMTYSPPLPPAQIIPCST